MRIVPASVRFPPPTTVAPLTGDDARDEDETRVSLRTDDPRGEDETRVLRPDFRVEDDPTEAFSAADEADATADPPERPLERQGVPPHTAVRTHGGGVWIGRWVALAALILFAIVLIALLFGL